MSSEAKGAMPQISLQSKDHEELLDIIDNLRAQGISRYIDLPQLIVCGDQSSGKSSVLEAVSGLRFPTKDNLCTRFATELILRRGRESGVTVTIIPGENRSESDRADLQAFEPPAALLDDFGSLFEAAEKAMGLDKDAKAFTQDRLRVEVCGPKQPHLTLVDLPGLFHAGNKAQSENDAESVKSLVLSYMEKSRSIILAVVSAKNDYANQIVTKYARDLDPSGNRTLGIVTKPDTLHPGSDSERAFVELAENRDVTFRLGWHVLKNRDYDNRNTSSGERDAAEAQFFARGIWTSLPPSHVGIGSLKPKLSRVLKDQILTELPSLIRDVQTGVDECRNRLALLGGPRATVSEQRLYLLRVSQSFSSLIKAAVDGVYVDAFFGAPMSDDGYSKRLRAVVQNTLMDFSKEMDKKGHSKHIMSDLDVEDDGAAREHVDRINEQRNNAQPVRVARVDYVNDVSTLMKRTRGCELPGTFNPQIIGELFFEQAKPWQSFVESCREKLLGAARTTVNLALEHVVDQATIDGLFRQIINPSMKSVQRAAEDKAREILAHHQRGHPITYNHYLIDNIQKAREDERSKNLAKKLETYFNKPANTTELINRTFSMKSLLTALSQTSEVDMDRHACSEAMECMMAYYKVHMLLRTEYLFSITNALHRLPGRPLSTISARSASRSAS